MTDFLTNMRFANDVLLFASSKEQLQKMLCEFKRSAEKGGLRIHPGKTKILSNQSSDTRKEIEVDNTKLEKLTRGESARSLGQMITFQQQETTEIRNPIRAAWATFHKYRQELTSKNYLLKHRLRLFDAVITPTICYASGTWTPTKEHERMIQSTQRKMLRLIIQTKRRYKKIVKQKDKTNEEKDTNDLCSTGDESEDGQSSNTHKDQDSDVSFENDTEEEIDTSEIEEEDWIDYIKKHKRCHGKDGKCEDSMLEQDSQKMKWRLAMGIATSPSERRLMKAAEWNPELSSKCRTNRAIGRPRKRWEDDSNEFLKLVEDETENFTESSSQINKTRINAAKDRGRWALLEEKYTRLARPVTASTKTEGKVRTTTLVSRKVESDQGGLMSNVATRFLRFSCCLPGSSWIPDPL